MAAESHSAENHSCTQWKQTDYPFLNTEIYRE